MISLSAAFAAPLVLNPFGLITLDVYSVSALEAFRLHSNKRYEAVKAVQKGVCSGTVGDFAQVAVIDVETPERVRRTNLL